MIGLSPMAKGCNQVLFPHSSPHGLLLKQVLILPFICEDNMKNKCSLLKQWPRSGGSFREPILCGQNFSFKFLFTYLFIHLFLRHLFLFNIASNSQSPCLSTVQTHNPPPTLWGLGLQVPYPSEVWVFNEICEWELATCPAIVTGTWQNGLGRKDLIGFRFQGVSPPRQRGHAEEWVFSTQLTQSRNFVSDMPRGLLPF